MARLAAQLASRLHSVYRPDLEPALALRIRHADGSTWSVVGETLAVQATGQTATTWTLADYTLTTLAAALVAAGFEVPFIADELAHLSAAILLEGTGDQNHSNGDHLTAYTSLLQVVLHTLGRPDEAARAAVDAALAQLILPQATAEWLDLFGDIFGISRLDAENDGAYAARIAEEVKRNRSSPAAILRNIRRLTGHDLALREPWKEVFFLSDPGCTLSGAKHLQGAPIYEYHRMQLISPVGIDWGPVLAQANADRPVGTLMLAPATHPPAFTIDGIGDGIGLLQIRTDVVSAPIGAMRFGTLSGNLNLSDYEPPPRFRAARIDVMGLGDRGLRGPYEDYSGSASWSGAWDDRTWMAASTALPEMYPPRTRCLLITADGLPFETADGVLFTTFG